MPLQSSVAESQGFEPWEDLTPRSISSAVPSTTRTTLHDDSLRHRPPISCWKQERKTGEKTLESDIWTTSDVQQFQGIRVFLLPKCSGVFECCTFDHSDNSPGQLLHYITTQQIWQGKKSANSALPPFHKYIGNTAV